MAVKVKAQVGNKWYTLSRESKALFRAGVSALVALSGAGHLISGMLIVWNDVPRSTQHLVAGLVLLYLSDHRAFRTRRNEDKGD